MHIRTYICIYVDTNLPIAKAHAVLYTTSTDGKSNLCKIKD